MKVRKRIIMYKIFDIMGNEVENAEAMEKFKLYYVEGEDANSVFVQYEALAADCRELQNGFTYTYILDPFYTPKYDGAIDWPEDKKYRVFIKIS